MKRNPAYGVPHKKPSGGLAALRAGAELQESRSATSSGRLRARGLSVEAPVDSTVRRVRALLEELSGGDEEASRGRLKATLAADKFSADVAELERRRAVLVESCPGLALPELSEYVAEAKARLISGGSCRSTLRRPAPPQV